ncbi:MAG: hypothetical protein NC548_28700 [Lachnospiraceae bacterium]|nr:hypothetical protein [Lachnospiraceae bacterium]
MKAIFRKIVKIALQPINGLVMRTNWYRNVIVEEGKFPIETWYRKHIERNYDIVNIGSSSAVYAFNYEGLPIKAFNWALQPQSMEYSYRVLKNFHSIIRQNGIVLIPFSPFSGLSVTGKWSEKMDDRYFGILDSTLIDNYNKVAKRRLQPLLSYPLIAIKRLIKDEKAKYFPNCSVCKDEEDFENDAKRWVICWQKEFNIDNLEYPLSNENVKGRSCRMDIMKEMINFCTERGYQPVLVMPPLYSSLSSLLPSHFRENYINSFIRELQISTNVPYLDYMDDIRFSSKEFFYNSFFLNEKGAKKFTKQVLLDLGVNK